MYMESERLRNEFEYYLSNLQRFVDEYEGKYVVLKNKEIIGVYDSQIKAYLETQKEHKLGTFLIQFVKKGVENYTQTFYSRVSV